MAIGAVDMLIPPSALTVLLGSLSGISISKLLIGGVVPGLMLSVAFVGYIVVRAQGEPSAGAGDVDRGKDRAGRNTSCSSATCCRWCRSSWWSSARCRAASRRRPSRPRSARLPPWRWPLAYRALSFDALLKSLRGTVGISAMILFIILGATTFSQILSFSGATEGIVSTILGGGLSPFAILAGMMLLLIFLGIFVDQVSMMLITLPVFMPIVQRLDIDLIWFGVLYLICMQLGLLLPPHGLLLMTMKGVAPKEVTMAHIFRAVVPYVAMSLVLLIVIIMVPAIATWLPNVLG